MSQNLRSLKILRSYKNQERPSHGALLFFAKDPQQYLSYSKVRFIYFQNEDRKAYKDQKEFVGTLDEIIDQAQEYWAKNLIKMSGLQFRFKRTEFFEYPLEALREALINALVHRNYADPSEVLILQFPTRILIKSPGSFPPGVSPEEPEHKARNPLLSQWMYDFGYIEKYGSGILKMKEACRHHPLVNVYFHLKSFATEVEFKKEKDLLAVDELNQRIVHYLSDESKRSSEVALFIGVSKQTAIKRLQALVQVGLVSEEGRGPSRRYRLKDRLP